MHKEVLLLGSSLIEIVEAGTVHVSAEYQGYKFEFENGGLVSWRNGSSPHAVGSQDFGNVAKNPVYQGFRNDITARLHKDVSRRELPSYHADRLVQATGLH